MTSWKLEKLQKVKWGQGSLFRMWFLVLKWHYGQEHARHGRVYCLASDFWSLNGIIGQKHARHCRFQQLACHFWSLNITLLVKNYKGMAEFTVWAKNMADFTVAMWRLAKSNNYMRVKGAKAATTYWPKQFSDTTGYVFRLPHIFLLIMTLYTTTYVPINYWTEKSDNKQGQLL